MHNNYYFLRQLSPALQQILVGAVISECFSQHKDELIIRFETHQQPFYIKANLQGTFSCLSFSNNFSRARKNSINLFEQLIGLHVRSIRQFENERSFALMLTDEYSLLFKMHGNKSNILLYQNQKLISLFKNNIPADASLFLETLDRKIDWSFDAFVAFQDKLPSFYFTFGKIIWKYLASHDFSSLRLEEKWDAISRVKQQLEQPAYYITLVEGALHLSLIKYGDILKTCTEPVDALNAFYYTYIQEAAYLKEKTSALSSLRGKLQSSENYYQKTLAKLIEVESDNNYKMWADLLMANLHQLKQGLHKVALPNFYNADHAIEIKLKQELSPQKNAENFYRKAKNQHIEIERLKYALEGKEKEIKKLKASIDNLTLATDLKTLRKAVDDVGLNTEKEKQAAPLPYYEFEVSGYKIWVGKNAQHNDTLTFKYGYKEDLWLHAKDVAGSHVLIKHQAGKKFPKNVIERAAALAAYNSKRKNETLCPVIVTPKKFVRKRKGDPAGAVVVDREEVILVQPKLDN